MNEQIVGEAVMDLRGNHPAWHFVIRHTWAYYLMLVVAVVALVAVALLVCFVAAFLVAFLIPTDFLPGTGILG